MTSLCTFRFRVGIHVRLQTNPPLSLSINFVFMTTSPLLYSISVLQGPPFRPSPRSSPYFVAIR